MVSKSSFVLVVISPPITTTFDLTKVSHATRLNLSPARHASRTASEIVSATLSGCPSPTDSEEKMYLSITLQKKAREVAGRLRLRQYAGEYTRHVRPIKSWKSPHERPSSIIRRRKRCQTRLRLRLWRGRNRLRLRRGRQERPPASAGQAGTVLDFGEAGWNRPRLRRGGLEPAFASGYANWRSERPERSERSTSGTSRRRSTSRN